jgi:preprotein translocase subunit SecF
MFPILFITFSCLDTDQYRWWFAGFAFLSLILSLSFWKDRSLEYEFTGEEIIERRAGRIKNRIRIADVIETKVKISPHELIIKTNSSKMTVIILPSLNATIQEKASEIMANTSEADRQHYEKVKKDVTLRLKRANAIGLIILVLVIFLIGLLAAWLKKKGFFP